MELKVERIWKTGTYCGGKLFINGKFFAYTIEDADRGLHSAMTLKKIQELKKFGITAIPTGRYEITMTFSNRFKRFMMEIMNVKGYGGIRIHVANKATDVEGCIGVAYESSDDGFAGDSAKAIAKLEKDVVQAMKTEKVFIEIV